MTAVYKFMIVIDILLLQNEKNAFALHSNKPNLLSPDAFFLTIKFRTIFLLTYWSQFDV